MRAKQADWLNLNRWRYSIDCHGKIKVDQDYYNHRMKTADTPAHAESLVREPNFEALL
jgi:hypothetical protein